MGWKAAVLFGNEIAWLKTGTERPLDITMGTFDGADTCELKVMHELIKITDRNDIGLYRVS